MPTQLPVVLLETTLTGQTTAIALQHALVQLRQDSEIILAQMSEMWQQPPVSLLNRTGVNGRHGAPVLQHVLDKEAETDSICAITQKKPMWKFVVIQATLTNGVHGLHARKLVLEVLSKDQDNISARTKFKPRTKTVEYPAHGVIGITGQHAQSPVVEAHNHATECTLVQITSWPS